MKKKILGIFIITFLALSFVLPASGTNNYIKPVYQNIIGNNSPQIQWWYDLDAPSFGSAAVDDFDGDGKPEIVFGTYFNDEHIYALNAEDGTLLWKYNTGGCNDASPVIADVDLDGDLEVIIPASSPYKVYCFDGESGDVEWATSTGYPNCIDSPPAIADVDNDNKPEVILGTFYGYVFCLNGEDGGINWQINLGTDSYIQSRPNILDLDSDGQLDIVVSQFSGDCRVYGLKGDDGSTLWYSDLPQDYMYHGGSFEDIDEDDKPEIVIGCYDNHMYVFNGEDGSLLWDYTASYYIAAPTSIADLNNDGHLEIVFASYNKIGVLSHTGSLLWSYPTGGSIFRGASIADINGDGTLDVCFGSDDGKLRVLEGDNGQVVWTYDLQAHYGDTFNIDYAPTICDFDSDGKLDIFVVGGYGTSSPPTANHGRAYVLSAGDGTGPGWPMFRYDLVHSACFGTNKAPVANFTFIPNNPSINETVTFTDTSTDDGTIASWYWNFGDGDNSTVQNPTHQYTNIGTYIVTLNVTDNDGMTDEISKDITVINNPPIPPVMWTEDFYTFYICTPQNPDGDHIYYLIDWGDGTSSGWIGPYEPGETISISHVWSDEGTYQIKAKAKDQDGESKCAVYSLTLSSDLKFFSVEIGYVYTIYKFTIYWKEDCECWIMVDWGDGETSDWLGPFEQPLLFSLHAWSLPGEYVLRIKIKDIYGNESDWITFIITILSLENNPPAGPTINGPTSGKVGVEYKYNFSLSDPDNDSMYLRVDWGSGTPGKWDGLFSSGSVIKYNHTWQKKGPYIIRAQTQDSNGLLSDWTEFEVTIPRNKASVNSLFLWFLERFPLLERLLNLLR